MSVLVIHVGLRQSGGSGSQGVGELAGTGNQWVWFTKPHNKLTQYLVRGIPYDIRGTDLSTR